MSLSLSVLIVRLHFYHGRYPVPPWLQWVSRPTGSYMYGKVQIKYDDLHTLLYTCFHFSVDMARACQDYVHV